MITANWIMYATPKDKDENNAPTITIATNLTKNGITKPAVKKCVAATFQFGLFFFSFIFLILLLFIKALDVNN